MNDKKPSKQSQFKGAAESFRKAAPYFNIAYVLMASIVMLAALGWWLDDYLSSRPVFVVIGIIGGLFLGLYNLYKMITKIEKNN